MPFEKLKQGENNSFFITKRKSFEALYDLSGSAETVFEFAYGMTFGKKGGHRDYRTGGELKRKNGELFINTFQGKLAEFGIWKFFSEKNTALPEPDVNMWAKGKWDDTDLIVSGKKINVKSAAHFSNLLLLETKDWDADGHYIPNKEKGTDAYDYFILSRLKPDGKALMKNAKLFSADEADKDVLKKLILTQQWKFDIAGFISSEELKNLIAEKFVLPQHALLEGRIKMDAENYYCQSGGMHNINELLRQLGGG